MKYKSLMFALLWTGIVYCQDSSVAKPGAAATEQSPAAAGQTPATRSETSSEKMAKIVVYRERAFKGSAIKPPVLYDGLLAAYLYNGSYVELVVPAGQHIISSDKEGSRIFAGKRENLLTIDAKPGEVSYVRLEVVMGAWHGLGEVHQASPEEGKAASASLPRQEPDWTRAGKTWLDSHTEPALINVNGSWRGSEWGDIVLHQTEGSGELKGSCDKWDINGLVSGNRVYLLFASYGDVAYSAVLTAAGDNKILDGDYAKGVRADSTAGKTIHLTKE